MYGLPLEQWKEIGLRKRAIAQAARCLPGGARLKICGLPAGVVAVAEAGTAVETVASQETEGLYRVPRGWIWSRGAHLDAQARIVSEISDGVNRPPAWWMVRRQSFFPPIVDCPGTVFSMIGDSAENLYHWTFDILPRLRMLDPARRPHLRVLARLKYPFHRASLEAAGFLPESILPAELTTFYRTDELLAAGVVRGITSDNFSFARELYLKVADPISDTGTPVRLYISRARASSRKIANEAELEEGLKQRGFQIACFEDVPFAEQISLMARAGIIVSAHGAAWTLAVVARPGAIAIEILPAGLEAEDAGSYHLYRNLSRAAGLDYRPHHGEPVSANASVHKSDLRVSVAELLREIDAALAK